MKNKTLIRLTFIGILISLFLLMSSNIFAQIKVNGKVIDEDNEPLFGVTVIVKGTTKGTSTDAIGQFELIVDTIGPIRLIFTYIGFEVQEELINSSMSDLSVIMHTDEYRLEEIVIGAYRLPESWIASGGTVELLDQRAIQQASAPDPYDDIANLKGVQAYNSSLNFSSYNFRGFGAIANERFVQLVDGMDNSAPLLNFPTGNIVGVSGLDLHSAELVPGAASALYGPNAFNGILIMKSKNPFDYQGLSLENKTGFSTSDAGGSDPYYQLTARYAKAFNNRFAFKLNASWLKGTDWRANDYTTGRRTLANKNPSGPGAPDFDGLNTYGDETQIIVPMAAVAGPLSAALAPVFLPGFPNGTTIEQVEATIEPLIAEMPTLDIRRTGFTEEDLLENMEVKSIKMDGALHYRFMDSLEASYNYRFGRGSTVYQGGERYVLRDFNQQFHKLELQSPDFFARGYVTATDAGDSYNLSALGAFANERFSPSSTEWVPSYAGGYAATLLQKLLTEGAYSDSDITNANLAGRQTADASIPKLDSKEFTDVIEKVRRDLFQKNPPGAGFVDDSRLYHAEFGYNFPSLQHLFDLQVGGNYRQYNLFSDGTIFNEDPEGNGSNDRVKINEYGFYGQLVKKLVGDRLKLSASIRYDKNENFEGQLSPRLSAVYSAGENRAHNFRASFQTGFRNPSTQQQFIFFPTGVGILLGSTQANAERYGIHNGGAYTNESYNAFLQSVIIGMPNPSLLQEVNIPYVKPEQIRVYEVGYKAILNKKLVIDANAYFNTYEDFISQRTVRAKEGTTHQGMPLPGVQDMLEGNATSATAFRPYVNASESITSLGLGLGLSYKFYKKYTAYGHYNYSTFEVDDPGPDFESGFNMPENKFLIGLRNYEIIDNLGFDLSYRWQDKFLWENSFAHEVMPSYGVLNAQINYTIEPLNTMIKLGGSNILGSDYRTNAGGPFVGTMYYISLTFDNWLQKTK